MEIVNMNEEEFFLECDSVSNLSSLSGCTLDGGRHGVMEARMYDLLTVASDFTSLAELSNSSFRVEVVEDLLTSDDKNNAFLANLSGHRTLLSEDDLFSASDCSMSSEMQSETEFEVQSDTEFEVQSETEFEVESDSESEDDECENDVNNALDIISNHSISLDQKEKTPLGAKSASATSIASLSNESIISLAVNTVPAANRVFEQNGRLERARQRRIEALERYKNVLSAGSPQKAAAAPVDTVHRQQSLMHLVSAIEAMDGSAILAASAQSQSTAKASAAVSGSTRVRELRSRQQESLRSLVTAWESVRDHKGASPSTHYFKKAAPTNRAIFRSIDSMHTTGNKH